MAYSGFDLTGSVALVTGGNRGIGLGMAEALGEAGAALAIWGSNAARNMAAAERLAARGVQVETFVVDVSDEAAVEQGFAATLSRFGRVDSVFANAGVPGGAKSFAEFSTEAWRRALAVNLDGVFFTFRAACRHMIERAGAGDPGGSLVVTASIAAIEGAARSEAYAATKGGVISMMKAIAVEHARYGVRANAILPGWIATDMTEGAQGSTAFAERVMPRVPARRWGEPADFGGAAVYLASRASSFHTGDTLIIDGGYSIF